MRWIPLTTLFIFLLSTGGGSVANSFVSKACDVCPEMVLLPAGSFRMGDLDGDDDEKPVHRVNINVFALGKTEVTFAEYDAFARETNRALKNDGGWGRGNRPVINVNWNDAKAYVKWLSNKTGKRFRLPSEAEWEYAARAGSATKYSFGNRESDLCDYANHADHRNKTCSDGADRQSATVGRYRANAFGLFDMHGNVWEWVEDCYYRRYQGGPSDGSAWTNGTCEYRVLRGGSWYNLPKFARSAFRGWNMPARQFTYYGIRVAQDI